MVNADALRRFCRVCKKPVERFLTGNGGYLAYYCVNHGCEKFGDLTIAVDKEEEKPV